MRPSLVITQHRTAIQWQTLSEAVSGATGYTLYYRYADVRRVRAVRNLTGTSHTVVLFGRYIFWVTASNESGESMPSDDAFINIR